MNLASKSKGHLHVASVPSGAFFSRLSDPAGLVQPSKVCPQHSSARTGAPGAPGAPGAMLSTRKYSWAPGNYEETSSNYHPRNTSLIFWKATILSYSATRHPQMVSDGPQFAIHVTSTMRMCAMKQKSTSPWWILLHISITYVVYSIYTHVDVSSDQVTTSTYPSSIIHKIPQIIYIYVYMYIYIHKYIYIYSIYIYTIIHIHQP